MSFNRAPALEAQPTTFRREDDPQYADDPEFNRFTTDLSDKLFSMTSNINQLSRQVDLLVLGVRPSVFGNECKIL